MKWHRSHVIFFIALFFIAPTLENFIFGYLIDGLTFPISSVSTAMRIFPKLQESFYNLTNFYSAETAKKAVLLYANLASINFIACAIFAFFLVTYFRPADHKKNGNSSFGQIKSDICISAALFLVSIFLMFFLKTSFAPAPGSWQGKLLSAEMSTVWVVIYIFNVSFLFIILVFRRIFLLMARESMNKKEEKNE